jgi:apolipoprotein N-acyltransferase
MPFFPLEQPAALDILAHVIPPGTTLITGALRHDETSPATTTAPRRAFNSILVLDEEAKVKAIYDKIKLVPGGEVIPYESLFSLIGVHRLTQGRGFFAAGPSPRPLLHIPGMPPALGLVCYEALFPGEIVEGAERPSVLINVTNDGWFGDSSGPYQHFHQARVRAVEEGLPLIRAANNGISAVVDPYGRTLAEIGLNVRAAVDSRLPEAASPTPYSRWGDAMFLVILFAFAAAVGVIGKTRHQSRR